MRFDATLAHSLDRARALLADPDVGSPAASCGAMAGSLAASLLASACTDGIEHARSEKAEDELRAIRQRCLSLGRDLVALVERGSQATSALAVSGRPGREAAAPAQAGLERTRALLFAAEVPLRTAESCHALLNLALQALGRAGVRGIAEIGTGTALAFAGVVGGVVTARGHLAAVPAGTVGGVGEARKRAERILRDSEALRTQITDRVRQHLP